MGMTKLERGTRKALAEYMRRQGYVTYAGIFLKFDLNFYRPKEGELFAAAMVPGKYRILINPIIDDRETLSMLIRHEILHEYLKHQNRLLRHLAEASGQDFDELDDLSIKQLTNKLYANKLFNIAGDYEISNRGYTENDKELIRNIGKALKLTQEQAEQVKGLVTEDEHPDWVNLPIEDMYDLLQQEREEDKKEAEQEAQQEQQEQQKQQKQDDEDGEGQSRGGNIQNSSKGNSSKDQDDISDTEGTGDSGGSNNDSGTQDNSSNSNDKSNDTKSDSNGGNNSSSSSDSNSSDSSEGKDSNSDGSKGSGSGKGEQPKDSKGNSNRSSNGDSSDNEKDSESGSGNDRSNTDEEQLDDDGDGEGPSGVDLDKYDEEELEKQDKEREEQIQKELDELEDLNPDSEEAKSRLEEIADLLNDQAVADDLFNETDKFVRQDRKKRREQQKRAEAAAGQYAANNGIDNFVLDLNKLIKREVKKITKSDWGRFNKRSEGSGLIKPGKSSRKNPMIPRLFVYFDQSGSWGSDDIKVGEQALATLNTYVKKNQLVIELYYFANNIYTDANEARNEGGTGAGKKLIDHIKTNHPDNVVIMTDADFDAWDEILQAGSVTVPGGAFLLFRGGAVSKRLVDRVRGKKLTKIYKF